MAQRSFIATVIILFGFVLTCTALTQDDIDAILKAFNDIRSRVDPPAANMEVVKFSTNFSEHAEALTDACVYKESPFVDPVYGRLGMLISNWGGSSHISGIIQFMERYRVDYNFGDNTWTSVHGHIYKTMVTANLKEVGCAQSFCPTLIHENRNEKNRYFTACYYSVPEDTLVPYIEGEPASQCPEDAPKKDGNLCMEISSAAAGCPYYQTLIVTVLSLFLPFLT